MEYLEDFLILSSGMLMPTKKKVEMKSLHWAKPKHVPLVYCITKCQFAIFVHNIFKPIQVYASYKQTNKQTNKPTNQYAALNTTLAYHFNLYSLNHDLFHSARNRTCH